MHFFDIAGSDFFRPLTGKNKSTFIDCINIIYETYTHELSYGVKKDYITEKLIRYFEDKIEELFLDDVGITANTPRDKSNAVLRRLKECGWIDSEVSFDQTIITLYEHSVTIIEALHSIEQNKEMEYETSVAAIYSILSNETMYSKPYEYVIKEVYSKTKELITGLKKLNTSIKKYIDKITVDKEADEIIKMFFEYQSDIGSKAFKRIHTSDNISRFRSVIIDKLTNIKRDDRLLKATIAGYMKIEDCDNEMLAEQNTIEMIISVIHAFESSYDEIVKEISFKNEKYVNSAVARAKFLLINSNDIEGKLSAILKSMSEEINKHNDDLSEYVAGEMDMIFEILPQGFIDDESLYTVAISKKIGIPEELNDNYGLSEEERDAFRLKQKLISERKFSRSNINNFVSGILADKDYFMASELPIQNKRDVIRIIYMRLYGQYGKSEYCIEKCDNRITSDGVEFNDFKITRRKMK